MIAKEGEANTTRAPQSWKVFLGLVMDVASSCGSGFWIGCALLWAIGKLFPNSLITSPMKLDSLSPDQLAKLPSIFGVPIGALLPMFVVPFCCCAAGLLAMHIKWKKVRFSSEPRILKTQRRTFVFLAALVGGGIGLTVGGWVFYVMDQVAWIEIDSFGDSVNLGSLAWLTGAALGWQWMVEKLRRRDAALQSETMSTAVN